MIVSELFWIVIEEQLIASAWAAHFIVFFNLFEKALTHNLCNIRELYLL
jgi:hypothetical protein